jgi:hypothetical protein
MLFLPLNFMKMIGPIISITKNPDGSSAKGTVKAPLIFAADKAMPWFFFSWAT